MSLCGIMHVNSMQQNSGTEIGGGPQNSQTPPKASQTNHTSDCENASTHFQVIDLQDGEGNA